MCSVESRFVIGSSDILSAGVYVCTFQPGNFTGCGRKGVKRLVTYEEQSDKNSVDKPQFHRTKEEPTREGN